MSIKPELLELIHADLDGLASDQDRARLREAIAREVEVREEYRRLRGLGDVLARVDREVPPARLAPAVMSAIRARQSRAQAGVLSRLHRRLPEGGVILRYGYAIAAGMIVGVLGLQWVTTGHFFGPLVPERDATATLAPANKSSPARRRPLAAACMLTTKPEFITCGFHFHHVHVAPHSAQTTLRLRCLPPAAGGNH